jgi:hypothetical protein
MESTESAGQKRKSTVTIANWLQPKKHKPESDSELTNAPPAEKAPLQELLDFSSLSQESAIVDRFDQVGSALLHDYFLVVRCEEVETEFRILELEFYLQKANCHEDPFTHGSEEQKLSGRWCAFYAYLSIYLLLNPAQVLPSRCKILCRLPSQLDELD